MKKKLDKTELERKWEAEAAQAAATAADAEAVPGICDDAGGSDAPAAEEPGAWVKELEETKDRLLRLHAEFDNYRKRTLREAAQARASAAAELIREWLPVLDNLERALEHAREAGGTFADGVAMVCSQFHALLRSRGVEPIPALDAVFDPHFHEALAQTPADRPAGVIVQEFERGYRMGDHVLRHAKVIVSSGPPQSPDHPGECGPEEENHIEQTAGVGNAPAAE